MLVNRRVPVVPYFDDLAIAPSADLVRRNYGERPTPFALPNGAYFPTLLGGRERGGGGGLLSLLPATSTTWRR